MKQLLTLFLTLFFSLITLSQAPIIYATPHNNSENLNDNNNMLVRYWYYRWRLQNDFLIMGENPGYSIPAEDREGAYRRCLRWGDGTIWLGNYIIMLATENALLRYSNRYYDLLKNERELYYAMEAFNRLDEQGDTYYDAGQSNAGNGTPMPACKNGFFLRDDVPCTFFTSNYLNTSNFDLSDVNSWATTPAFDHFTSGKAGFNYHYPPFYANSSGGLCPLIQALDAPSDGICDYNSSYVPISHQNKDSMKAASSNHDLTCAISQDQVYRLLAGFAAVIRTLPSGAIMVDMDEDGYGDTPFDFVEQAKIHSTNIIARLNGVSSNVSSNAHEKTCSESVVPAPFTNWQVKDPLFEKPGIGNNSYAYSPELTLIWSMFYSANHNIPNLTQSYVDGETFFANAYTSPALIANAAVFAFTTEEQSNAKLLLYSSMVADFVPNGFLHDDVFNRLFNISKGNTNHVEKYFAWHTYMMPLYCYLNNFAPQNSTALGYWAQTRSDMSSEIYEAPCIGPYNYVYIPDIEQAPLPLSPTNDFKTNYGNSVPAMGNNGWNTTFRFDQTAYRRINGYVHDKKDVKHDGSAQKKDQYTTDNGFFNGIDYMSEVNLYYITSTIISNGSQHFYPFYHNLIDRYVDYDVSSDNTPMLGGFNSITLTKNVTGSAALDVQAGDHIDLKDGTHITASNASKHLYIKTFSCSDFNTSGYQRPSSNDSTPTTNHPTRPMNNDYGFNEVFPQMDYDVHPIMSNAPSSSEIISKIRSMSNQAEDSLLLFPNPAKNTFCIKNTTTEQIASCNVHIISSDGKEVEVKQERGTYDISTLATGTYIIKLIFPSGVIETKKLIKLP